MCSTDALSETQEKVRSQDTCVTPVYMQIICRRLKPLLARQARMTSRLTNSLIKLGIPITTAPDSEDAVDLGDAFCSDQIRDGSPSARTRTVQSVADLLAIDPGHGEWMLDVRQMSLWPRLRANLPMVVICSSVVAAAVVNVATMTVAVNGAVASSPRAELIHVAALDPGIASGTPRLRTATLCPALCAALCAVVQSPRSRFSHGAAPCEPGLANLDN